MLPFITLDGISCATPDGRVLFDGLTLAVGRERIGVVGHNGAGKSTLLRVIAGELAPFAGVVSSRARLGVLDQDVDPGTRLGDVLGVSEPLRRLSRIEAGAAEGEDLALAEWDLPLRMEAALAAVGLKATDPRRSATSLSGGEAVRAALAGLIIAAPDVILMDEPTNNLDGPARALVAQIIGGWDGGVVVASHDRALLRRMDRIVELSSLGVRLYGGGWDLYAERRALEARAAREDLDAAERRAQIVRRETQAARERKDRRDAAGRRSRARGDQPKILLDARAERAENTGSRLTAIAERRRAEAEADLEAAQARVESGRTLAFGLTSCGLATAKLVLAFEDVAFAWAVGRPVLDGINFRLVGPARLAVVGPNGSGKTTLVSLAGGALAPTRGRVIHGVAGVTLDQRAALLRDDLSLRDNFQRLNPEADVNAAQASLARFLFRNVQALRPAGELSGGERLRAALACVLMARDPPKLIILDEPTNHLDLESIAAVEGALRDYDGAILAVSHDEDFLAAIGADKRLELG